MKQEIKEKWVAALRSGEYKQTKGYLHNEEGFCCLGVLTDLCAKEKGIEWEDSDDADGTYAMDGCELQLPSGVVNWAGLPTDDPYVNTPEGMNSESGNYSCLTQLNDGTNGFSSLTFAQIADIIENTEEFN
jgi:hypothetical protein